MPKCCMSLQSSVNTIMTWFLREWPQVLDNRQQKRLTFTISKSEGATDNSVKVHEIDINGKSLWGQINAYLFEELLRGCDEELSRWSRVRQKTKRVFIARSVDCQEITTTNAVHIFITASRQITKLHICCEEHTKSLLDNRSLHCEYHLVIQCYHKA